MITTSTSLKSVIGHRKKKRKKNIALEKLKEFRQLEKQWERIYAKAKASRSRNR